MRNVCARNRAGEVRKLRPEWWKKQELAVNLAGSARVREKITARMSKKARFGRKFVGSSPGGRPKPLGSRENYGQNGGKSKFWP